MRMISLATTVLATGVLFSSVNLASAQYRRSDFAGGIRDAAAKADFDAYYFYRSEAAAEELPGGTAENAPVPAAVAPQRSFSRQPAPMRASSSVVEPPTLSLATIQNHASELRSDLAVANQSYAKLSSEYKNNAEAEKYLNREHQHRQAALAAIDRLQADTKAGRTRSRAAQADARTVQVELAAASGAHWQFVHSIETSSAATTH